MIETLIDKILLHDRIVIVTDLHSYESLNKLLRLFMNYIGKDGYIEHNDDTDLFEDFIILNKHYNKRIISTSVNVWLSNTHITDSVFGDAKFILPYRNMLKLSGLPHFPGNHHSIPTKLTYTSDLILSIDNNLITVQKIRSTEYRHSTKIDMDTLLNDERTIKVNKIRKLIA